MTQVATTPKEATVQTAKSLFAQKSIQDRFEKLMGQKAQGFISSVLQTVQSSSLLSKADPMTVLNAAATAASLDLPINQNLGFAWIVPYKGQAQFQIGWRGFVQLALRTGQYKNINVTEVYANQFKSFNRMTEELDADFGSDGVGAVVGYVAYFRLLNGFEKTEYWSRDKVLGHAKKYSKAFNSPSSPWSDPSQFDAMAKKTVLKSTLSKWGIMSIEMNTAVASDQAVVTEDGKFEYVDNEQGFDQAAENQRIENERVLAFIAQTTRVEDLEHLIESLEEIMPEVQVAIDDKRKELTPDTKKK